MEEEIGKIKAYLSKYVLRELDVIFGDINRGFPSDSVRKYTENEMQDYKVQRIKDAKHQVEIIKECGIEGYLKYDQVNSLKSLGLM